MGQEPKRQPQVVDRVSMVSFTLRDLLVYFLRLGTLGFGGPIALAGHMQKDLVEERRWVSKQDYLEGLAFSQLSPGPLAAQLAMYLGWIRAGTIGATLVGIAFILPSFLMVLVLAALYVHFGSLPWIQGMFYGIGAAVIAMFVKAPPLIPSRATSAMFVGGVGPLLTGIHGLASIVTVGVLFLFFLKAGAFVFGSGLAIVPFLYGGVVAKFHWLTERQFVDAVAVAMITPGPVVITAAFIGYVVAGTIGAILAAFAVFAPPYLIILVGAPYYRRFAQNQQVKAFVQGVTAAAVGAIAGAAYILARRSLVDLTTVVIALITLAILMFTKKIPEPIVILVA